MVDESAEGQTIRPGSREVLNLHVLHTENEITIISKQRINGQYVCSNRWSAEGQTIRRGSCEVLNLHILHTENEIIISKQRINGQYVGSTR